MFPPQKYIQDRNKMKVNKFKQTLNLNITYNCKIHAYIHKYTHIYKYVQYVDNCGDGWQLSNSCADTQMLLKGFIYFHGTEGVSLQTRPLAPPSPAAGGGLD